MTRGGSGETGENLATLRVRVTAAAEAAIRGGHPWVYSESVREQNRAGRTGELAVIFDRRDRFLAVGFFDADSPLRVRVLHVGKPRSIDAAFWRERLLAAVGRRAGLFDESTTGYRLIHGESDGWPGVVLDRYGSSMVLKLYSAVWLSRVAEVSGLMESVFGAGSGGEDGVGREGGGFAAERLVLRLSRNIQEEARRVGGWEEGRVLFGAPVTGSVVFRENGLRFEAEILRGQKTGFFLDQRENRSRVESMAAGCDVLNAFSFSGGFSLYAARGGARSVTDLDISEHALESARRNFALNRDVPAVAGCPHRGIQAEAFEWLGGRGGPDYDLVILDPPSLARRESERAGAIRAYERLAGLGLSRLRAGGVLVAASCSAHVTEEEFFEAVGRAVRGDGRGGEELGRTGHAADHPAGFTEARYLKCVYVRVGRRKG